MTIFFSSVIPGQAQLVPGISWIAGSSPAMTVLFFFCHPRTSAARSGDLWIVGSKPTMTKRKISTNMTGKNKSPEMTILFLLMPDSFNIVAFFISG
jgi:hypothetical protein